MSNRAARLIGLSIVTGAGAIATAIGDVVEMGLARIDDNPFAYFGPIMMLGGGILFVIEVFASCKDDRSAKP